REQLTLGIQLLDDGLDHPVGVGNPTEVVVEASHGDECGAIRRKERIGSQLAGPLEAGPPRFFLQARARPALAVASSRSSSKAGTPAFAKCAAIWAPIVPAPRTATDPTKNGRGLRATSIGSGSLRVETT